MRKVRFFCALCFFTMSLSLLAAPIKTLTLDLKDVSFETFIDEVEKQTGVKFLYSVNLLQENGNVTVKTVDEPWDVVLKRVLDSHNLTFKFGNNEVVIYKKPNPIRHVIGMITGKVYDDKGDPIVGANIAISYTDKGTLFISTNEKGDYSFKTYGDEESITASFVGYVSATTKIRSNKKFYAFNLKEGHQLNDVVVTGIFNKPKVSFTGAATIITSDEIKRMGNRNLLKTLSNIDPSFDLKEDNAAGSDPNNTNMNIEIRGTSSITSVNDLQNGVRNLYSNNLPLFILDGFEVTPERVMDMNQADVESVVILKDASATAIYGSRGSNGVVVITSKKPEFGRLRVTYQGGFNLEIPDLSSYHLMNSFQKLEAERDAGLYTSSTLSTQLMLDNLYNENLKAAHEGVNTQWIKMPVRVGIGQYHRADFSGGNDQFRYILNFSYNQNTGAMKGSGRNNLNGNMTISYLFKKIRFTNNLSLGFNKGVNSTYGEFSQYTNMNPYWKPYGSDGKPVASYQVFATGNQQYSPLYDAAQTSFSTTDYTDVRNTTMLDMDLLPDLRINLNIGFSQQRGGSDQFQSPKSSDFLQQSIDAASRGAYTKMNNERSSYQISGTGSWAKVFGAHTIYLGINSQIMENRSNSNTVYVKGFMNDQMTDISNGNTYSNSKPRTDETTVRSLGVTGTFNYNYAQRYFFDASYREDAASSFGSESRWAPFWSVGAAWDASSEPFVKKVASFIKMAKLRYSYGVTGSLDFAPYDALTTYQYNNDTQYTYLIGATIMGYGNPRLKWQNTKQSNYGLDLSIGNRLTLTADYYYKITDNLLSDAYLSLSHGYDSYKENLGKVRNTGYDLSLSYNLLRLPAQNIDWSIRLGAYHNSNILVKLSDAIKKANATISTQQTSFSTFYEYREGQSIDEIYALHSIGIDPESGRRLYQNPTDGTVTTNPSGLLNVPVGVSQPKINGRFGTTFRWAGLMVDLSFGCRLGGQKLNTTLLNNVENANISRNQDVRVLTQRWKKPGDIAPYKNIASTDNSMDNDCFVFTENTLTLNDVNLSYDFPLELIRKFKMQRLSLTASMSDIFYISNIRQERGTDYPYTIKPTFSIACTF